MPRLTRTEKKQMLENAVSILTLQGPTAFDELATDLGYTTNRRSGLSVMLRNQFHVYSNNGVKTVAIHDLGLQTEGNNRPTYRQLIKVIEKQSRRIDELEAEQLRLQNKCRQNNSLPTMSDRAKKALAVFGD